MFTRFLMIVALLSVAAAGVSAGEIDLPTALRAQSAPPVVRLLPGEGDGNADALPHSCYGDSHEKDSDLNAFYPITDEDVRSLLNPGA